MLSACLKCSLFVSWFGFVCLVFWVFLVFVGFSAFWLFWDLLFCFGLLFCCLFGVLVWLFAGCVCGVLKWCLLVFGFCLWAVCWWLVLWYFCLVVPFPAYFECFGCFV